MSTFMHQLRNFGVGLGVFLLLALWGIAGPPVPCQAQGSAISASMVEPTKVKVTFQMPLKKSGQIRLFRRKIAERWEKVAKLKGNVKSYEDTVKFNHTYEYKAVMYKKQGKKYKKSGMETCFVSSRVLSVYWYGDMDEQYIYPVTTPEEICIRAEIDPYPAENGLQPNGYAVYRSTDNENFTCIKSINTIDPYVLRYVDRDIQKGQTYYYKLRGFFQQNQKKYYGLFSHTQMCMAANSSGIFSAKVLAERGDILPFLDICLASDEGNAELVIQNTGALNGETKWDFGYFSSESTSTGESTYWQLSYPYVLITKYSADGINWFPIEEDSIVIKPGQTIYLRFEMADGRTFSLDEEWARIYDIPVLCYSHDDLLEIDLIEEKVHLSQDLG